MAKLKLKDRISKFFHKKEPQTPRGGAAKQSTPVATSKAVSLRYVVI